MKKVYSLEETVDLLSSNNVELEELLKNDDPDPFTAVPETDDSIVKTSEGAKKISMCSVNWKMQMLYVAKHYHSYKV